MLKLSKKFALPLIAVLLIGTGVGGYFLFKNFQIPKYFVDKYPELIEYCDTEQSENSLKVSCKALMLDIKPNVHNGTPSLTSLVITNDEELKEYIITEKEEVFAWTNDVLQYKKLKPIVINLQYVKKNPIQYSLQGITFENIPDTYIQEIVNRDIEEIMGMDRSSTTILNSFDFCPRPETLPDYVIKKEEYAKYWSENILSEEEYKNGYNYSWDDNIIRMMFACKSSVNISNLSLCNKDPFSDLLSANTISDFESISPRWGVSNNNDDISLLKEISILYDNTFLKVRNISTNQVMLDHLIEKLNRSSSISEDNFCSLYFVFNTYSKRNLEFKKHSEYIKETTKRHIGEINSPICFEVINETESFASNDGLIIKSSFNTFKPTAFYLCDYLNIFLKNE